MKEEHFNKARLDATEAVILIQHALGGANCELDGNTHNIFKGPTRNSPIAKIEFDNGNYRFTKVEFSHSLQADFYENIESLLKSANSGQTSNSGRALLSDRRLNGYIDVPGHFRIFPIHQWADIGPDRDIFGQICVEEGNGVDSRYGPPFPIFFEVEVDVPQNHPLFIYRLLRKLDQYQGLVSLCIRDVYPLSLGPLSSRSIWVPEWNAEKSTIEYHLAKPGFPNPDDASFDRYVKEGGLPNGTYGDAIDYHEAKFSSADLLTPPYVHDFFARFDSLGSKEKGNFARAAFLFCQAEFIGRSSGDPIVSYVSAIECIFDKKPVDRCESCKQDRYSLTKKFNDFMAQHAPVSDGLLHLRDEMYKKRSKSVHGVEVQQIDAPWFSFKEFNADPILFPWLVRKALVNWMLKQD